MAGGKLSPRQKMINLMYLVFISMMAMSMSKEVLTAFGSINEGIQNFNERKIDRNSAKYADLKRKASEQTEKYGDLNKKAQTINKLSRDYFNYLDGLKAKLMATYEFEDGKVDYEQMDKGAFLDEYFFIGGKLTKAGQEYVDRMNAYRDGVNGQIGNKFPKVSELVSTLFNTADVTDGEGITKPFLNYHFSGFPSVASLTKFTETQAKITRTEDNVLNSMLQGQLSVDAGISASTYRTILIPEKPAFFAGENFKGKIVLGRYDESLKPSKVIVNGKEVTELEAGGAVLNFPAGNVGERDLKGEFVFVQDGKEVKIPIEASYTVIGKPSDAVISADKMNVVYRGLPNPLTISVPGVADKDVKASARGLRKSKGLGKYIMTPSSGKEVSISVSFTLPGGTSGKSTKKYRIKDIPKPMATVRKESGLVKMPKASLTKTTVRVELPDFLFDLNFKIKSFKIKVPGQPTITVNGSKLNGQAIAAVNKARPGDLVAIFDVKSAIVGVSNLKVPDALPVTIEIQ